MSMHGLVRFFSFDKIGILLFVFISCDLFRGRVKKKKKKYVCLDLSISTSRRKWAGYIYGDYEHFIIKVEKIGRGGEG